MHGYSVTWAEGAPFRVDYDKEANALYIHLLDKDRDSVRTVTVGGRVHVDLDTQDEVAGVEILLP